MERLKELAQSVWYWICVQFQPFDEITARELVFVSDVRRYCCDQLLVESDEAERVCLEFNLGRVTEIEEMAGKHRRNVRRTMSAKIWACLSGDWETFRRRGLQELHSGLELTEVCTELRRRCPGISALHMGADSNITIPRG